MSKIVPLISSGLAGPLGVLHLPRLWQKACLEACGKLADGYPGIGQGYDMMTINAPGLSESGMWTGMTLFQTTSIAVNASSRSSRVLQISNPAAFICEML